jgi:type III secretion protein Q
MLDLPRYSVDAACAISELATRLPLAMTIAGQPFELAMPARQRPRPGPDWHRAQGTLGSDAVALALHPEVLPPLAAAQLAELTGSALPAELRGILVSVVLRDIDDLVESCCGVRPEWVPPGGETTVLANLLTVARGGVPGPPVALLQFDDGALARVAACCRDHPPRHVRLEDLPVVLDLLLDRAPLSARELRTVKPGDLVLLSGMPVGEQGIDVILSVRGGPGFRARSAKRSLTLTAELDAIMDPPAAGPAGSIDDIELQVEFTIGQLLLPISRVRELAVGQILDLGFDATTAVTLRVNGQAIAIGELVRIAERTGVRIAELRLERA